MKMNYVAVGANAMRASNAFHDGIFAGAGFQSMQPSERMPCWLGEDCTFAIAIPFDEGPATNGNGTMIGFSVRSMGDVDKMHGRTLEHGGTCEGAPGQHEPEFSAYMRDLDSNKPCLSEQRILRSFGFGSSRAEAKQRSQSKTCSVQPVLSIAHNIL